MKLKALVVAVVSTVALQAGIVPAHAATPPLEPVILVHGWTGNAAGMATMREAFTAAGYQAYTLDLPGQNNIVNAARIADLIASVRAQTGAERVHLIGHSMGGLSARYYIKNLLPTGVNTVRTYVSMGTSQYGYWPACLLGEQDGGQMCPTSKFLRDLNPGDDTPGDTAYYTFRASQEDDWTTHLDGGACFWNTPGVEHKDEPNSPVFIQAVIGAVEGVCPGEFRNMPSF